MMCDFKPGDEVVCIRSAHGREGQTFTVAAYQPIGTLHTLGGFSARSTAAGLQLNELPWNERIERRPGVIHLVWGYDATCFRKVQRRDLSAWLKTSIGNTDKLDKRQTKKVRA